MWSRLMRTTDVLHAGFRGVDAFRYVAVNNYQTTSFNAATVTICVGLGKLCFGCPAMQQTRCSRQAACVDC